MNLSQTDDLKAQRSISGSDRRALDEMFAHPLSHNLAWTEVVSLMERIGTVEERSNSRFVFQIGGETQVVHKPHSKQLTGPEVLVLRRFIERAGLSATSPSGAPDQPAAATPSLIVVIDHHEAKVYHADLDSDDPARHAITPHDPRHLLHNAAHKDRSSEHRESATGDRTYYEQVAEAVAKGGRIVVVSHGAGESNAGHKLAEFLRDHHPDIYRRIVREVVADISGLTGPELLQIARQALAAPADG